MSIFIFYFISFLTHCWLFNKLYPIDFFVFFYYFCFTSHSMLSGLWMKSKILPTQRDLCREKEHASRVQNTFCLKSYIYGHEIHQLGSLDRSLLIGLNGLSWLASGFYGHRSRISNKMNFEPLRHTLSTYEGPIERFQFDLKSSQHTNPAASPITQY